MRQYFQAIKGTPPVHEVKMEEIEGRSGTLAVEAA
jgi:hypothetical protein